MRINFSNTFYKNSINNTNNVCYRSHCEKPSFGNSIVSDEFVEEISPYQTGQSIPKLGTIIDTPEILNLATKRNEKCLVLFQTENQNSVFRLIRNNAKDIKTLSDFMQREIELNASYISNSFSFSKETIENIKKDYPQIYSIIKDLTIAEIFYQELNQKEALDKLDKLGYKKPHKDKSIIIIQNFINYKKDFKHASRCITIPMLKKLLNENHNIVIKAAAFGENPSSPVNLYLRYGFVPLGESMTDIKKHIIQTDRGNRIDPDYKVVMYLPTNAILYKLIKAV